MSTRKAQTRERILDAAWRLLVERGYHSVGLDEVAREAGISRQALYRWHFGSKSELLLALVGHVNERIGVPRELERYRQAPTALAALEAAVAMQSRMEARVYEISRVLYSVRREEPAAEAAWQDVVRGRHAEASRLARRLQEEGVLAEGWAAKDAADLIWALLSVHIHEYLVVERGWTEKHFADAISRLLRRGLTADPAG